MSPTSYQAAPPRITFEAKKVPHGRPSVKCHQHIRLPPTGWVDAAGSTRTLSAEVPQTDGRPSDGSPVAVTVEPRATWIGTGSGSAPDSTCPAAR